MATKGKSTFANTAKSDEVPTGLPALRAKRQNHDELQPVSSYTTSGKKGYVK